MMGMAKRKQAGAALLLLLLVVIVAASSVLVTQLSDSRLREQQKSDTQYALAAAKRALIDFAASYPDRVPGAAAQLPCPDIDASGGLPEGEAHVASCGASGGTVLGRFPWRTVGIAAPHDASGSCLWYAVSGTYKSAGAASVEMINPDSNGQLQTWSVDSGFIIEGAMPEDRPVAVLLAPRQALSGQSRSGIGDPARDCSNDFTAADFLDAATGIGVSNASVSGTANSIESFAVSAEKNPSHNDGLLTISRDDLADAVYGRHDFDAVMTALTRGLASCIAAYGIQNPAGANDRRLPWPAPVGLGSYTADASYDDADNSVFSGRLPDAVSDSNALTGNTVTRMISDCNSAIATDWNSSYLPLWQNWKDHFFYTVAESYEPRASVPTACGICLSVNGSGAFSAAVLFSGERLSASGQRRNAPPIDTDTKQQIANYLEGRNASNHPYTGGAVDYESALANASFNDIAFCVDSSMAVTAC